MNAADALYAGFADTMVATAKLPALIEVLCKTREPVSVAIAQAAAAPHPSHLADHRAEIDKAFRHDSVEAIRDALAGMTSDWAKKTLADFEVRSPLAMKATLAAITRARKLGTLEEALDVELRLCSHLYEHGEFIEGVRALLVDKDKSPKWSPSRLEDVTPAMVEALFQPVSAT